ncbi:MAG: CoB--CoM heterodisulfide reductase iron-sulfur subunit A family protein [Ignavibacteria bacterium]|nr:CoB--CoM heterodisulfide reductase iron-sulfur subunit A family protein [Ignavibacteria bacterium]
MNSNGAIRIGFYICHCGTNIAGVIDVDAVAAYAASLPGVVLSRDYKYMCSDPGQDLIAQDIREQGLNRIVVASCSPLLHERTFRGAVERGGLNPFLVHMVNIREHGSWVHEDGGLATTKAMDLVRAAVRRVVHHIPLERSRVPVHPDVLVVGGGIAGIHAALTLAAAGKKVTLVEREPSIGGHMAQFDKTFPTLDCAACILTPKMTAVKAHPNITLWTYSEVTAVKGSVGNFTVTVKRKPRYIREDLCVGCLECIDACIYKDGKFADEFNLGLSKRKPIYVPFPQAVPAVPVVDPEHCVHLKTGKCKDLCVQICAERNAFDFDQQPEFIDITVGAVILATGFTTFDAKRIPYYGYGVYPNVYTALEAERLVNASGPTGGEIVLPDGRAPASVAIVHCVGSRDADYNRWCSRVCCMYSLKLAHLIQEHTKAEIYNFYIDMRSAGKSMEEFYNRVSEEGVHLIRGRVADIYPETANGKDGHIGRVIVQAEDTLIGRIRKIPVDMVILSVGLQPQDDAEDVRRMFNISCSAGGFFLERHPKLAPVNTFTDGIYLAGACQGPKDIPDAVAQAGAAAAEALALIDAGFVELEPNTAYVMEEECSGCKSCIPLCPYSAISFAEDVLKATINAVLCKGCGTCVASCPSASIRQHLFEDAQIFSEIEGLLTHA